MRKDHKKGIKDKKSRSEFIKLAKAMKNEPTNEEGLDFYETDSKEEQHELKINQEEVKPLSFSVRANRHLKEHLVAYLISLVAGAVWIYAFVLNSDITKNTSEISNAKDRIEDNSEGIESLREKNTNQEIEIKVNSSKIKTIEDDIQKVEQDIKKIDN